MAQSSNEGAPLWLATFADLMSLLVCFFVLFLSFSTIDDTKFKKMAFSLDNAFKSQNTKYVVLDETPKEVPSFEETLEEFETHKKGVFDAKIIEIEKQEHDMKLFLATEINEGLLTVEREQLNIIIRIKEKGSFSSGSATLQTDFKPVMDKITQAVVSTSGIVHIAGHTDDVPISTELYGSNWELAASRSVTVAHFMMDKKGIDPARIVIEGYAHTRPLVENDSVGNMEKNRRVEIIIVQKDPSIGLTLESFTHKTNNDSLKN